MRLLKKYVVAKPERCSWTERIINNVVMAGDDGDRIYFHTFYGTGDDYYIRYNRLGMGNGRMHTLASHTFNGYSVKKCIGRNSYIGRTRSELFIHIQKDYPYEYEALYHL